MNYVKNILLLFLMMLLGFSACEPEITDDGIIDGTQDVSGVLEVHFDIIHRWIPEDRIIRVGMHVAKTAMSVYTGDYLQSAYVTNSNSTYTFLLAPGIYYYDAVIACLCEQDSCLIGGFPGSQYSKRHSIGKITIYDGETTIVKPAFN